MVEKEALREKEAEELPVTEDISRTINKVRLDREKAIKGRKVIKGNKIPFTSSQQGIIRGMQPGGLRTSPRITGSFLSMRSAPILANN